MEYLYLSINILTIQFMYLSFFLSRAVSTVETHVRHCEYSKRRLQQIYTRYIYYVCTVYINQDKYPGVYFFLEPRKYIE